MKNKADVILVGFLLLLCVVSFIVLYAVTSANGNTITITVDGKEYGTYDLSRSQEIPVVTDGRTTNVVVIEDGKAYMKDASCPDHLCMMQGKISQENELIVCLPNRVVVTANGEQGEFDAVTD